VTFALLHWKLVEKENIEYSQTLLIDYFILVQQFSVPIMSLQMTETI
jgi:hypothetical protein